MLMLRQPGSFQAVRQPERPGHQCIDFTATCSRADRAAACLPQVGNGKQQARAICQKDRRAGLPKAHTCSLKMEVSAVAAALSSPEWMASMMARVYLSFMRLPTPYLQARSQLSCWQPDGSPEYNWAARASQNSSILMACSPDARASEMLPCHAVSLLQPRHALGWHRPGRCSWSSEHTHWHPDQKHQEATCRRSIRCSPARPACRAGPFCRPAWRHTSWGAT